MPKIKTNKSASKRIKVTKSWKLIHKKSNVSHLLTNKGDATKKDPYWRQLSKKETKKITNLIPHKMR